MELLLPKVTTQESWQTDSSGIHCTDAHEGKVWPGESNSGICIRQIVHIAEHRVAVVSTQRDRH